MSDPLDLNVDLTETDTSMPRLAAGEYVCQIKSAEVQQNKAKTGHNLVVTFKTLEEAEDQNGDPLKPGMEVRKWLPLQQSDNPDAPDYLQDICRLFDAAFRLEDPSDRPALTKDSIASLVGETIGVVVTLEDDDKFGLSNNVKRLIAVDID